MDNKEENEKLIGKLIKKRKAENDAFMKLLNAIDNKGIDLDYSPKSKGNPKSK